MEELIDNSDGPESKKHNYRFASLGLFVWSFLILAGKLMEHNDISGGTVIFLYGTAGLMSYSLHGILRTQWKDRLAILVFGLSCLWLIFFAYTSIVLDYPYNYRAVFFYLIFFGVAFSTRHVIYRWRDKQAQEKKEKSELSEKVKQSLHTNRSDQQQ